MKSNDPMRDHFVQSCQNAKYHDEADMRHVYLGSVAKCRNINGPDGYVVFTGTEWVKLDSLRNTTYEI